MPKKRMKRVVAIVLFFFALVLAYGLLRPPEQKPAPPAPPQQEQPAPPPKPATPPEPPQRERPPKQVQPIKGVPPFDAGKYPAEPMISVYLADRGRITRMKLETYLEGVIAQEMMPDWPVEALAAQAITARTLTYSAIESGTIRRLHNADVSTSKQELQAYAPEKVNDAVRQAVRTTRGKVILYGGGLVNSIYSSCNGQVAATREESFPREITHETPYFQPVKDECFKFAPENVQRWEVRIPAREVAAVIGYKGDPADIKILAKGPSGRMLYIGAGDQKMYGAEFRKAVGFDRLKSTLVTDMRYDGGRFVFRGMGWGNGVGLCQWGAYTYAKQGLKAEDIIKKYYQDVEIIQLYQ